VNQVYKLDVPGAYPASAGAAFLSNARAMTLATVVTALRRRLPVMAAVFLATFVMVAAFTFQLTPVYTATSSIIVNVRAQQVVDIGAVLSGMPADTAMLDTEAEVLRSRGLIGKVVKRLDLVNAPEFNWRKREPEGIDRLTGGFKSFVRSLLPAKPAPVVEADPEEAAAAELDGVIDAVRGAISVNRLGSTYMIEISARSTDPRMAASLANTVASAYLDNQLDQKFDATRRAQKWLDERVGVLREEVREAESRVEAHRARTGLLSAEGSTLTEQAIRELNAQLTVQQADLAEKRARLQNVTRQLSAGAGADAISEALSSQSVTNLRVQQAEIVRRKADLQTRYGDRHPEVQRVISEEADLQRQIDAELRRIVSSLEQDVLIARERVNALQSRLNLTKFELASNNSASVQLNELQREAESSRQLYEEFLNRFKETAELEGITEADAAINALAPVPGGPSFPNTNLNLALGFLLGLALAGLVALVLEVLDNYFSTAEDVEQHVGVPYIGSIPLVSSISGKPGQRPADYLIDKPHSGFAEAFRNLRAAILFSDLDKSAKTVAIVSSLPDEGKTSATYCLGRMCALSGTRTIVIDGDVRRRQLTEVAGIEPQSGLLEVLFGEVQLGRAIVSDEATGLHILPLAERAHTPRDVFGSRAFDAMIGALRQSYDLIIIDTGPILLLAETRVLAKKVDQVVVAARWRKTNRGTLRETIKVLREFNATISGVVLTFVDLRRRAYANYEGGYRAYTKYYQND
jgi:exopolysaccharide transport family protein